MHATSGNKIDNKIDNGLEHGLPLSQTKRFNSFIIFTPPQYYKKEDYQGLESDQDRIKHLFPLAIKWAGIDDAMFFIKVHLDKHSIRVTDTRKGNIIALPDYMNMLQRDFNRSGREIVRIENIPSFEFPKERIFAYIYKGIYHENQHYEKNNTEYYPQIDARLGTSSCLKCGKAVVSCSSGSQ